MINYKSRKYLLCVLTLAACTFLLVFGFLTSADFRMVVLGTVGAYVVGNVAQKALVKSDGSQA